MTSSTFYANSAVNGGGIYTVNVPVNLAGNIFQAGTSGNNCRNTMTDNGYNLSSDGTCAGSGTGSQNSVTTLNLGTLSTTTTPGQQVHTPGTGSTAIGTIPYGTSLSNNGATLACNRSTTDQLGTTRPVGSSDLPCTAGAVEVDFASLCPAPLAISTAQELSGCILWANYTSDANTLGLSADITLGAALPTIDTTITLAGNGYAVDGASAYRVFVVTSTGNFTVNNTTIQNGAAEDGAGISNSGTMTITGTTIRDNAASTDGGGIANAGTLSITNSTLAGNSGGNSAGGIVNEGTLTITNSTFSSNSAAYGGAIVSGTSTGDGILTMTSSTFSGNSATTNGGGIFSYGGEVYLAGNIFQAGSSGENCIYSTNAPTDNGYNLSSDASCGFSGTGSQNSVTTLNLDTLSTTTTPGQQVHTPGASSAAAGTIPNGTTLTNNTTTLACSGSTTDQLGTTRPIVSGDACTAGAVEVSPPPTNFTIGCGDVNALVEAIEAANGNAEDDVINLTAGCTYELTSINNYTEGKTGLPVINNHNITINGNGATITRNSANTFRIFLVSGGSTLTLNDVSVSNGDAGNRGGGAVYVSDGASLIVNDSTLTGNSAAVGGAVNCYNGNVTITTSRITNNIATSTDGSAILMSNAGANGSLTITDSTFSGNDATRNYVISMYSTIATITGSTFNDNSAEGAAGIKTGSTTTITNCTFTGNESLTDAPGLDIYHNGGTATVNNCTFTGGLSPTPLYTANYPSLQLGNSIIASSSTACSGTITDLGNNLATDASCGVPVTTLAKLNLGSLTSSYGGPTQIIPIYGGSDAVNAGDPTTCPATDQRGVSRIGSYAPCDIGAYEYTGTWSPPVIRISDASPVGANEGNSGTNTRTFTLTRSGSIGVVSTVDYTITADTASAADGDYVDASGTVTFPSMSDSQTITVTINGDTKYETMEHFTVDLSNPSMATVSSSNGSGSAYIYNDDTIPLFRISDASVVEGQSGTTDMIFTVSLSAVSGIDASATYNTSDATAIAPDDYTAATGTVTISAGSTSQTIAIPVQGDRLDETDETFNVTLSNYYNMFPADLTGVGTIQDDDNPGFTIVPASGSTTEAGGAVTFAVSLNDEPTSDVVIVLSSSDTSEGTVNPAALTFTSANWDISQSITVTGIDDDVDDDDIVYTIVMTSTSTDAGYDELIPDIAMINTDDDTAGVTITPAALTTTELGGPASFDVVLTSEPLDSVTVTITGLDSSEGTLSTTVLTFTSANWATPQAVVVTGVDDAVDDDDVVYTLTVTTSSAGDTVYNAGLTGTVQITNTDNDSGGLEISPTSGLTTTEAGGTATFTVRLNSEPTATVTVTPRSSDTSEGTVSGALTFTTSDWSVAQTVTVTGVNDFVMDGGINYTITLTASGGGYDGQTGTVTATNTDNDVTGIIVDPASGLITTEAGGTATFTVRLNSEPTATVTVTPGSSDTTEGTVSGALTFTASDWNVAQTVTVTGMDDSLVDGNIDYTITLTASGGGYDGQTGTVTATNTDNDTAGLIVDPASGLITTEAGSTATFTVRLNSEPTATVTVTPGSSDSTEGTVSGALTFTASDWSVAQTVTVTGVDDSLVDGNIDYTITLTASGGGYDGQTAAVTATNEDNDSAIIADEDVYATDEDQPLVVDALNGVLNGDAGGNGSPLQAVLDTPTIYGVLVLNADGSFAYTPGTGFFGVDVFAYHASDGTNDSASTIVTINVALVNGVIVAHNDTADGRTNTPIVIDVLGNDTDPDGDPLHIAHIAQPGNGQAALKDGAIIYTSDAGFVGIDSFTYTAADDFGGSDTAVVTITIWQPVPLCADFDGSTNEIIRADVPGGTVTDGSVFCRVLVENEDFIRQSAEVGNPDVLNRGVLQAVDVFALFHDGQSALYFNNPISVCLAGSGAFLYLDATVSPRTVAELPVYTQDGYTCASVANAGTVVLVGGLPNVTVPAPGMTGPSTALADCMVATRNILNLRESPSSDGAIVRMLPYGVTLTAFERTGSWFYVDYLGERGWVNAGYVTQQGACGQ